MIQQMMAGIAPTFMYTQIMYGHHSIHSHMVVLERKQPVSHMEVASILPLAMPQTPSRAHSTMKSHMTYTAKMDLLKFPKAIHQTVPDSPNILLVAISSVI